MKTAADPNPRPESSAILRSLPKQELFARTAALAAEERRISVELLEHLREIERRRLAEEAGYTGVYDYCVRALKLSEGAAYRRVQAMRALRDDPKLGEAIRDGRLNVTTAAQIQTFLRRAKRIGLTTKELESRLSSSDRGSDSPKAPSSETSPTLFESLAGKPTREIEKTLNELAPEVPRIERERPIGETEIEVRVTIGAETRRKWDRIRALAAHRLRFDTSTRRLVELTTDVALETFESRKNPGPGHETDATFTLKPESPKPSKSRFIPSAVRRTVWRRDGGRCRYADPETGRVCVSRFGLEVDHIVPWSRGGSSTDPENLRLLCAAHHRLVTERMFGAAAGPANAASPKSPHDGRGPSI